MSRSAFVRCLSGIRFPRVSGDEPAYGLANSYEVTFSPRERG